MFTPVTFLGGLNLNGGNCITKPTKTETEEDPTEKHRDF